MTPQKFLEKHHQNVLWRLARHRAAQLVSNEFYVWHVQEEVVCVEQQLRCRKGRPLVALHKGVRAPYRDHQADRQDAGAAFAAIVPLIDRMGAGCFEFARLQETVWFARVSDHLVDTSVWVEHLRSRSAALVGLLERGAVLMHPFVLGEAALGNLSQRGLVLEALANLPMATVANDREVLGYINAARLYGLGIGYVDAHLLASVRLTPEASLWTRDRRLEAAAETLGLRAPLVKAGRSVTAGAQPGNPHRRA